MPNLVVIQGNKFSFYRNREHIISVRGNMDEKHLEYYRKHPDEILEVIHKESD